MEQIPPLGWAAIILVILMTVAVNAWMIALLRARQGKAPTDRTARDLQKIQEAMKHPFQEETQQLGELSKRVHQLRQPRPGEPGQAEQPDSHTHDDSGQNSL